MSNTAANLSSSFFHMSATVAGGFKAGSFGVVNAAGTHAIGRNGVPSVWGTKRVAREIAPHIADCEGYAWVRIYPSREAAQAGG